MSENNGIFNCKSPSFLKNPTFPPRPANSDVSFDSVPEDGNPADLLVS